MPPGRTPASRPSRRALLLVLFILLTGCSGATRDLPIEPAADAEPLPFAAISAGDLPGQPFNVEGFVLQIYRCPDCPAGALCKPCDDEHLVIGPDRESPEGAPRLRIYTPHTEQFVAGRYYRFTLRARGEGAAVLLGATALE